MFAYKVLLIVLFHGPITLNLEPVASSLPIYSPGLQNLFREECQPELPSPITSCDLGLGLL